MDTWKGVNAQYNGANVDAACGNILGTLPQLVPPNALQHAEQYMCPELVRRFYNAVHKVDTSGWTAAGTNYANGVDYYRRAAEFGLVSYPNCIKSGGTQCISNVIPQEDDIVSFCNLSALGVCDFGTPTNPKYGHVAIIKTVTQTGSALTVNLIEQNWDQYLDQGHHMLTGSQNSDGTYTINDRSCYNGICGFRVQGWLRLPSTPRTGTVAAQGTLDGQPWPPLGTAPTPLNYSIVCPNLSIIGKAVPGSTSGVTPGSCTMTYGSLSPPSSTLVGISPCAGPRISCTASLGAGQTLTFTLGFQSNPPTAGFLMSAVLPSGTESATDGQTLNLSTTAGGSVSVAFNASSRSTSPNGGKITGWQWTINGSPIVGVGSEPSFSINLFAGTFAVGLIVTDGRGHTSTQAAGTVLVTQVSPGFNPTGSMNEARQYHTATLLNNGTVLVAGGSSNTAEIYDPGTGTWRYTLHPMNYARYAHTAVKLLDGRVLIAGGAGSVLPAEIFDPNTEQFTLTSPMNGMHGFSPGILFPDNRVLIVTGSLADLALYPSGGVSEIYDPSKNTWTVVPSIPVGYSQMAGLGLPDGTALAFGGYDGFTVSADPYVERYSPDSNSVIAMANMVISRLQETVTPLPDGKVLIVGGTDASYSLSSTELYDPTANPDGQSELSTYLNQDRRGHTATLLPSGEVLVVGGYQARHGGPVDANLATAELRDATSGVWSLSGTMSTPRSGHTATLLPSGLVLVTGGGTATSATNSAELWAHP